MQAAAKTIETEHATQLAQMKLDAGCNSLIFLVKV